MSAPPPLPKAGGGLSLYADLLDPAGDSSASISRGPQLSQHALNAVKEQEAAAAAAKKTDAALRFQPIQNIRRPQPKVQKPKGTFLKAVNAAAPTTTATVAGSASSGHGSNVAASGGISATAAPVKSTLADWANTGDDDEWMYAGEKRPRANKKKKKRHDAPAETDWNEIYDPSRPTNVNEYLRSDERIREVREWKALLYRHRRPAENKKRQSSWDSEEDEDQPMGGNQFAPPAAYSFAPPPPSPPRTAQPAAPLPDDKTGDDAYARRLALSQGVPPPPPPPPEPSHAVPAALPAAPPPPPPPEPDASTISRAPVRYAQPEPAVVPDAMEEDTEVQDEDDEDSARSNRPGKKGFAARLMSKYGWSKGQGLGAEGTGILAPLQVKVEKRKKKSDAEGGGWREPGGRGKIIQPKANLNAGTGAAASSSSDQGGKFGPMSNVIVLRHMLDNIEDMRGEMEDGLGQEIGEECGDKYGRVERLYIDTNPGGPRNVYIKFVETVSALRAVNALDGRVFAGSTIEPRFYDVEDFENGVYE